jgi:transcription elongation factor Elf1
MLYIDAKYASLLGPRLRNFKKKDENSWNFSCPVCGDSKKNKLKARGYIYKMKTDLFVKCHNCGYSTNLGNFIKYLDSILYDEYVLERYKAGATRYNDHKEIDRFVSNTELPVLQEVDSVLDGTIRIDKLPKEHPVLKYVEGRKIPSDKFNLIYFAPKFKSWSNKNVVKFTEESLANDHPRLIFPYFTQQGKCFAYSARAFANEEPKYYTIKLDDDKEKIYGLDRIDFGKKIFVVEGQIDSLFLPNCLAVSGSSFDLLDIQKIKTNCTLVIDNEPRNKEIVKQLKKYIDDGYSVCMFPDTLQFKDINEMILSGMSKEQVVDMINSNTYSGASAIMHFTTWRKV